MHDIYDGEGTHLGSMPLSDKQCAVLDAGESTTVLFHTPQLMRGVLGKSNGAFSLRRVNGRIVVNNAAAFREYRALQGAVAALKRQQLPPITGTAHIVEEQDSK